MGFESVVSNGTILLPEGVQLPEGTHVEVIVKNETEFRKLADQWHDETKLFSSISKQVNHPAYQRIISMGEVALPWILRELRDRPAHWFDALRAIAKETPVSPGDRANPALARQAWLTWGEKKA
jgi:hypothetical protein